MKPGKLIPRGADQYKFLLWPWPQKPVVDARDGLTGMGVPVGEALADEYKLENDDETKVGLDGSEHIQFPE